MYQEVDDLKPEIFGVTDSLKYNDLNGKITDTDLLATSFVFFVAGYETTATALAHLFYSLAVNQDCQQRLYEEIKQIDGKYDYETIAQMPYLEACVAETLRLYTPITAVGRMAADEFALMKIKTAIAYLITKYKFVKTANTTIPLKPKKFKFLVNTGDKFVGIEHRN
ncbi:cytochrome P450 6B7-like [Oppia nitens]|uniref:cytochrome P450 6B7-like n=1 Tax=Oppia nitens TaxID=1686743 RepID=UPI0023D9E859|nr:cytochrome P450 6B7-like [Oppia nitens]